MRYIGNKNDMLPYIANFIDENIPETFFEKLTFFDLFSGTGTVSDYLSYKFNIYANDYLYSSYAYTKGRLNLNDVKFNNLDFDPFDYFNSDNLKLLESGFMHENYSLGGSDRMYFSEENAMLIDTIRVSINKWRDQNKINENEYYFLLASLLESVSKVANVAGVYGSYLKKWDPRAIKKMQFIPVEIFHEDTNAKVFNEDASDIVKKIETDILYLDPPYTKNQYSTQYHLLDTIAKYDNPEIRGVTGTRTDKNPSLWSKKDFAEVELEKIIRKSKAKYIVLSYSSLGIIDEKFIELVLKRYGKTETYNFVQVPYKKYQNTKTNSKTTNSEYLFFVEKKTETEVNYTSPLNYIGSKEKVIDIIKNEFPSNINTFYDLFAGGFNVGINSNANKIVYNDLNFIVKDLVKMFKDENPVQIIKYIKKIIKKYKLGKNEKDPYTILRSDYNKQSPANRDSRHLYTIILYGFQQQIRFNSKHEFNNPVGQSSFNINIEEKIISFSQKLRNSNVEFFAEDFSNFTDFGENDFVYCDPPYLITLGSYNDGKRGFEGWDNKKEVELLNYLTKLNNKNTKFMLSNILNYKGKKNDLLLEWLDDNGFRVINYKKGRREEVLIMNY